MRQPPLFYSQSKPLQLPLQISDFVLLGTHWHLIHQTIGSGMPHFITDAITPSSSNEWSRRSGFLWQELPHSSCGFLSTFLINLLVLKRSWERTLRVSKRFWSKTIYTISFYSFCLDSRSRNDLKIPRKKRLQLHFPSIILVQKVMHVTCPLFFVLFQAISF
jgi:hypothetical protein